MYHERDESVDATTCCGPPTSLLYTGFLRLREIRENLEKTFYSGKTWKTQGKIWILPDHREHSGKKFLSDLRKHFRQYFLCICL